MSLFDSNMYKSHFLLGWVCILCVINYDTVYFCLSFVKVISNGHSHYFNATLILQI